MPRYRLRVNGRDHEIEAEADMPLLWALRDLLELTGTRYGCGIGQCGSCTVHLDGQAVRSCLLPLAQAAGRSITTIEGLADGERLHPVQRAWLQASVAQCGYCQSGMIMQAAAAWNAGQRSVAALEAALAGNLCRCGTHEQIRQALRLLAEARE